MSVYVDVEAEFADLQCLIQALDSLGIKHKVYEKDDGVYRKWNTGNKHNHQNHRGYVRGRDACLVIHGGLDTTDAWFCGDTAFIRQGDGTLLARVDTAHGNASDNWTNIQNEYLLRKTRKQAERNGWRVERIQTGDGTIKLRVYPRKSKSRRRSTPERRNPMARRA